MSEKKEKNKDVLEDIKSIALVLGGVVVGNLIDAGAQKILKLDKNASLSGIEEMKKFISPGVRIVGGGAGAYFVPNKMARLVLGGIAVSGAASVANYGMNKVLNKNNPNVSGIGEIDYKTIDQSREDMVLENYNPDLPDLAIDEAIDEVIIEQAHPIDRSDYTGEQDEFDDAEIL